MRRRGRLGIKRVRLMPGQGDEEGKVDVRTRRGMHGDEEGEVVVIIVLSYCETGKTIWLLFQLSLPRWHSRSNTFLPDYQV